MKVTSNSSEAFLFVFKEERTVKRGEIDGWAARGMSRVVPSEAAVICCAVQGGGVQFIGAKQEVRRPFFHLPLSYFFLLSALSSALAALPPRLFCPREH